MKSYLKLLTVILAVATLSSSATTVNLVTYWTDFTTGILSNRLTTLTPLAKFGDYNGANLSSVPRSQVTDINGEVTWTNVVAGYSYIQTISTGFGTTTITNGIATGTIGTVTSVATYGVVVGQFFAYFNVITNAANALQVASNLTDVASESAALSNIGGTGSNAVTNISVAIAYTNLFGYQPMLPVATSAAKVSTSSVISNNIGIGTNNFLVQEPYPCWVPERSRYECVFNGIGTLAATHWHIFAASSPDGITWTLISATPIINPGLGTWDGNGQPGPCLFNLTGTNWMFYGGTPVANPSHISMGVAFSTDGLTYTESGSNPILTFGSTTNFYEPMVTIVGSTWLMFANADANGSTGLGIYRFTASAATGPWTFGPMVIAGTNDFAGQVQGGGLANFSSSNIWAFIDNNNIADNYGVRRGVSAYWTSNALTGAWQYVGDVLTHSANGDWDAKAIGTEGACVTTNGQVLLMYAAPLTAANQSIGAATITTGFQPATTNAGYLATAAQPEWVRISQEQGRQSGVVHVSSDAGGTAASGLGTGPEDLWFAYSVSYDDGSVSASPGTYGWVQQIIDGSSPFIGSMIDQARIGSFTANSGTFLDIHVNQAGHLYVSTTCSTPISFVESPSTSGTSLQAAIAFNTNNIPAATQTALNGKLATNGNGSGLTSLNASQLTSGTAADARLSSNVALKNSTNTWTGNSNTFAGPVYLPSLAPSMAAILGANTNLTNLANGGNNTVLHGTTGPAYSAVVEADQTLADNTTANVSISAHGYAPKSPNDATKYLDGTGAYSVPAGSGGGSATIQWTNGTSKDGWVFNTNGALVSLNHFSNGVLTAQITTTNNSLMFSNNVTINGLLTNLNGGMFGGSLTVNSNAFITNGLAIGTNAINGTNSCAVSSPYQQDSFQVGTNGWSTFSQPIIVAGLGNGSSPVNIYSLITTKLVSNSASVFLLFDKALAPSTYLNVTNIPAAYIRAGSSYDFYASGVMIDAGGTQLNMTNIANGKSLSILQNAFPGVTTGINRIVVWGTGRISVTGASGVVMASAGVYIINKINQDIFSTNSLPLTATVDISAGIQPNIGYNFSSATAASIEWDTAWMKWNY